MSVKLFNDARHPVARKPQGCAGIADWWEPKETVSYAVNGVIYNWDGNRSMPYSSTTSMTAEEIVEA